MKTLKHLFANNRRWAAQIETEKPGFFKKLAKQQSPQYLWIGCSDSRVTANDIVGLLPGELFVHRNVANLVVHTDMNCLSVLQYAIEVLHVRPVIVCGHYGCGGVKAALENSASGLVENWLRNIRDNASRHQEELSLFADDNEKIDRMCELNVIEQVVNVSNTTIVRSAWENGQELFVHGVIYAVSDGLLRDLDVSIASPEESATLQAKA